MVIFRDDSILPSEQLEKELRQAERMGKDRVELYTGLQLRDVGLAINAFNKDRGVGELNAVLEGPYEVWSFRIRLISLIP